MPKSKGKQKPHGIFAKAPFIFPLKKSLKNEISTDFIALSKFSYMPVIKAIVPPETPGTVSAGPMANPDKK